MKNTIKFLCYWNQQRYSSLYSMSPSPLYVPKLSSDIYSPVCVQILKCYSESRWIGLWKDLRIAHFRNENQTTDLRKRKQASFCITNFLPSLLAVEVKLQSVLIFMRRTIIGFRSSGGFLRRPSFLTLRSVNIFLPSLVTRGVPAGPGIPLQKSSVILHFVTCLSGKFCLYCNFTNTRNWYMHAHWIYDLFNYKLIGYWLTN